MCGDDDGRCVIRTWKDASVSCDQYCLYIASHPACDHFKQQCVGNSGNMVGTYDNNHDEGHDIYLCIFTDCAKDDRYENKIITTLIMPVQDFSI